jgi:hypothetical protein
MYIEVDNLEEEIFIKLKKGFIKNLHPVLEFLDNTTVPFNGWFSRKYKYFYIEYGYGESMRTIVTTDVKNIMQDILFYEGAK